MEPEKIYAWIMLACCGLFVLLVGLKFLLRYRVSEKGVEVRLGGFLLRRVKFRNIERIGKRRSGWAEDWTNTFRSTPRQLVIHRKNGLRRPVLITPVKPYVFKAEIEKALRQTQEKTKNQETKGERRNLSRAAKQ